jgi:hypothetical protein
MTAHKKLPSTFSLVHQHQLPEKINAKGNHRRETQRALLSRLCGIEYKNHTVRTNLVVNRRCKLVCDIGSHFVAFPFRGGYD